MDEEDFEGWFAVFLVAGAVLAGLVALVLAVAAAVRLLVA